MPFDTIKDDDQIYTLKKVLILDWACKLEIGDCVSNAQETFAYYKNNSVRYIEFHHATYHIRHTNRILFVV